MARRNEIVPFATKNKSGGDKLTTATVVPTAEEIWLSSLQHFLNVANSSCWLTLFESLVINDDYVVFNY